MGRRASRCGQGAAPNTALIYCGSEPARDADAAVTQETEVSYREQARSHRVWGLFVLAEKPLHPRIKPTLDLGFNMRGEVVDHVLHDQ